MSDQDTIFNASDKDGKITETPAGASALSAFVGTDKKYATDQQFVEGFTNLTEHVSTVEAENAELREKVKNASKVEDVVSRLKEKQEVTPSSTEIETLVDTKLKEQAAKATRLSNEAQVVKQLTAKFGASYEEVAQKRAVELGLNTESMRDMMQNQPNVFVELFKDAPATVSTEGTTGSVNAETAGQNTFDLNTYSGWKAMAAAQKRRLTSSEQQKVFALADADPTFMGK